MQNKLASGARLGRQALLFPLCLVLYEFSTYIGNDMIQPGMLAVVEQYQAGIDWVPTSMTAYLAGGMFLQWLLGPLSDRIGRRPVMLAGVVWFIVTCLAILLAQNIEQFTLLRFLQGISLCFIGAVGYAAIQESFEEAVCIKITALMANVALIAPLLGPLVGAAWIDLEAKLEALQTQVADASFFSQPHEQTQKVLADMAAAEQELEQAFERWEYLEALKNGG